MILSIFSMGYFCFFLEIFMASLLSRYAVMGFPIEHSLSPMIHQLFAEQTQQAIHYDKFLVLPEDFEKAVLDFQKSGGKGLNITAPLKTLAFDWVNEKSEAATLAGSVNTIVFSEC